MPLEFPESLPDADVPSDADRLPGEFPDDAFDELLDDAGAAPVARRKPRGSAATVLGAAMIAVGEIFEPEKTTVEIVQTDDDPEPDLPFKLDFGSLPPLD